MSGRPVLVIGAGVGGLSAAIHLAAAGKKVRILEQNASVGGKMAERRQGGFRWDIGPSVITMRDVLEDAFRAAGRRMEDHLSLLAMEPLTRYFYPDGGVLDVERSAEATARRLAELDPREGEAYLRYLAYADRLFRITSPAFIYGDPPGLRSLLRFSPLDLLGIDGLRTMDRSIGRRVFTAHLRQLLDRFATYVGADPYQAPATLNVIAHVELNQGVWFPVGGIYSIAQALTDAAEAMGVEIRLGTRVQRILTRGGEVVGVETDSGETLEAEAVVTDIDAAVVYGDLLPQQPGIRRMAERLRRRERSLSAFILLLGLEGTTPALAHHNLLFSSDYEAEFRSLFGLGATAEDPSLYISISARSNPADAPAGCENWFVLANAPADSERWRGVRGRPRPTPAGWWRSWHGEASIRDRACWSEPGSRRWIWSGTPAPGAERCMAPLRTAAWRRSSVPTIDPPSCAGCISPGVRFIPGAGFRWRCCLARRRRACCSKTSPAGGDNGVGSALQLTWAVQSGHMRANLTHAIEDYIKVIHELTQEDGRATTNRIAERLGVTPPLSPG